MEPTSTNIVTSIGDTLKSGNFWIGVAVGAVAIYAVKDRI